MTKVTKAVIPCAGYGTRFLPATKTLAKELFPIIETPSIHYIVEECVKSGITDILIITSRRKKALDDYFDRDVELEDILKKENKTKFLDAITYPNNMAKITYVRQQEMKGTGNAVMLAETFAAGEPFAVLFGDDLMYTEGKPVTKQLIEAYENTGLTIVGCQSVPQSEVSKYGIIKPGMVKGRYAEIKGMVEKPSPEEAPSRLASLGRYVLAPDIFDYIRGTKPMANGEIGLPHAILAQAAKVGALAYDFEGRRYDIGDKFGYLSASIDFGLKNPETSQKLKAYIKDIAKNL